MVKIKQPLRLASLGLHLTIPSNSAPETTDAYLRQLDKIDLDALAFNVQEFLRKQGLSTKVNVKVTN